MAGQPSQVERSGGSDGPAGTFVHVVEPSAIRGAWAQQAGCILLVMGGKPGTAYRVQDWELEEFGPKG